MNGKDFKTCTKPDSPAPANAGVSEYAARARLATKRRIKIMYTQTIECKTGTVTITKTAGNIPISAIATRNDGKQWSVKNQFGITDIDRNDAEDFAGGIV